MRDVIEEQTAHAGVTRHRVLTLLDRLHRDGAISFEQFSAGHMLRHAIMRQTAASAGVSSYGLAVGHADPASKSNRWGSRLTGFNIGLDGCISWVGGRQSHRDEQALEGALFAAVGVHDEAGARRINLHHAGLLVNTILETENTPTLGSITRQLTDFYGATSKKAPALAIGFLGVLLSRLAQHYRLVK